MNPRTSAQSPGVTCVGSLIDVARRSMQDVRSSHAATVRSLALHAALESSQGVALRHHGPAVCRRSRTTRSGAGQPATSFRYRPEWRSACPTPATPLHERSPSPLTRERHRRRRPPSAGEVRVLDASATTVTLGRGLRQRPPAFRARRDGIDPYNEAPGRPVQSLPRRRQTSSRRQAESCAAARMRVRSSPAATPRAGSDREVRHLLRAPTPSTMGTRR